MAHQDASGHTVLDPCDFTPQGCTDATVQQYVNSGVATVAAQQQSQAAQLLPAGAKWVPLPDGYPLRIAPYITADGALNIPSGQGALTDQQIGWLMISLQNAINQGPPSGSKEAANALNKVSYNIQPYNINFVDYNKSGQIDNSGAQIIKNQTDPTLTASFHGGANSAGTFRDNYPNYDFFGFPAIAANVKQPSLGVMDAIIAGLTAIAPPIGLAAGAVGGAVHSEMNSTKSDGQNLSAGISTVNIPTVTGLTSGPIDTIANATGLSSTTVMIILLILILLIGYWYFKK